LPRWKPALKNPQENRRLENALRAEAKSRAESLLSGVLRYVETPYKREVAEKPAIWQLGNARLLDYGQDIGNAKSLALFVPSLINRYCILDLEEERSFLRFLSGQGVYPLVLDWGVPGAFEKDFGVGDYVTDILCPAIEFLAKTAGKPIALAGYCMGGVLALAAAQLQRKHVGKLALLATPWDFHCEQFAPMVLDASWHKVMAELIGKHKTLPADIIQSLFYVTDPFIFEHKFRRYANLSAESRAARDFVALEHWVNDGVPMTANVAKDCLIGWAQENRLAGNRWQITGKKINPEKLKIPTFIAIPRNDHVVPHDCAMALATRIKHAHVTHPSAGHVGMIVGQNAKRELWQPLAQWLRK
jgi:polyhydroxyalkanoate synthase